MKRPSSPEKRTIGQRVGRAFAWLAFAATGALTIEVARRTADDIQSAEPAAVPVQMSASGNVLPNIGGWIKNAGEYLLAQADRTVILAAAAGVLILGGTGIAAVKSRNKVRREEIASDDTLDIFGWGYDRDDADYYQARYGYDENKYYEVQGSYSLSDLCAAQSNEPFTGSGNYATNYATNHGSVQLDEPRAFTLDPMPGSQKTTWGKVFGAKLEDRIGQLPPGVFEEVMRFELGMHEETQPERELVAVA